MWIRQIEANGIARPLMSEFWFLLSHHLSIHMAALIRLGLLLPRSGFIFFGVRLTNSQAPPSSAPPHLPPYFLSSSSLVLQLKSLMMQRVIGCPHALFLWVWCGVKRGGFLNNRRNQRMETHIHPTPPFRIHRNPTTTKQHTCTLCSRDITGRFSGFTLRPVVLRSPITTASTASAVSAVRTQTVLGSPKAVGWLVGVVWWSGRWKRWRGESIGCYFIYLVACGGLGFNVRKECRLGLVCCAVGMG